MKPNRISAYLSEQNLSLDEQMIQVDLMTLLSIRQSESFKAQAKSWRYPVSAEVQDTSAWLLFQNDPDARLLIAEVHALLDSVRYHTQADWIGCYATWGIKQEAQLFNIAYQGAAGGEIIPLNAGQAEEHIVSRVGLTGWGTIVDYCADWDGLGETDSQIQSMICLPVYDETERIIGVVQAKSHTPAFFTQDKQEWLVALSLALPTLLQALPWDEFNEQNTSTRH